MPGRSSIMVMMNRLRIAKRTQIITALVERNSIRAACRMTGVAKNAVVKLLVELGEVRVRYQDVTPRGKPIYAPAFQAGVENPPPTMRQSSQPFAAPIFPLTHSTSCGRTSPVLPWIR
jgi:hypothetical protein